MKPKFVANTRVSIEGLRMLVRCAYGKKLRVRIVTAAALALLLGGAVLATEAEDPHHQQHQQPEEGKRDRPPPPVNRGGQGSDRIAQRSHAETLRDISHSRGRYPPPNDALL